MKTSTRMLVGMVVGAAMLVPIGDAFGQATSFVVEALNSPQPAGSAVQVRLTAKTVLNLSIPLYVPVTPITLNAGSASVSFSNASNGFAMTDNGNGTATLAANGTTFDVNGQMTFDITSNLPQVIVITATQSLATGNAGATWTVGAAHHLAFSIQPQSGAAGGILLPTVVLQDSMGNTVSDNRTITLTLGANPGSATLLGTSTLSLTNGVAAWSSSQGLNITKAGTGYTLIASHAGASLAGSNTVESSAFTVVASAADHMTFVTQPSNIASGAALLPAVAIRDAFENTVTNDPRTILLTLRGGSGDTLKGTTQLKTVNGVATWTAFEGLTIEGSGTGFVLRAFHDGAAFTGNSTVDSNTFAVAGGNSNGGGNSGGNGNTGNGGSGSGNGGANGTAPPSDIDNDGIPDAVDSDPANPDANGNGILDGLEIDSDDDGVVDALDPNPTKADTDDDGVLDGADNCPTLANGNQADADNDGMGDVCEDSDGDGVIDSVEDAAPNAGDGNADGTADRLQSHIASFETTDGIRLTLSVDWPMTLADVEALPNPSPDNAPKDINFPCGFIRFRVANLMAAGATFHVRIQPGTAGVAFNSFYNFGPEKGNSAPHWYKFVYDGESGAAFAEKTVTLTMADGKRGDDDMVAEGGLYTLGGLAIEQPPQGCGNGMCGAGFGGAFAIGLFGFGAFKRTFNSRKRVSGR